METFADHYSSLMRAISRYCPHVDVEQIERAIAYADKKHAGQPYPTFRSGHPGSGADL